MKKIFTIIILWVIILSGCKKDSTPHTSGIDIIDNTVYQATTYYVKGFSFANGRLVPTTATPLPDIVVYVNTGTQPSRVTLQTAPQKKDSFSKVGDYPDAASAILAFKNLTVVGSVSWIGTADPVEANQMWLYRTENDQYAKIRIVTVINELRGSGPYGQITFEWVFQPDGSPNFSVK